MPKKLHYESSGDNYKIKDPFKILALKYAKKTSKNIERFSKYGLSVKEQTNSRGESSFRVEVNSKKPLNFQLAYTEEGLGTKNLIADQLSDNYYYYSAIDNAASIFNDLSSSGASPLAFMLHIAAYPTEWFTNLKKIEPLLKGTLDACNQAGAVWGGGESATMRDIIVKNHALLSGSAIGIIIPSKKVLSEDKLVDGDRIILLESSGVHANGITLLRRELLKRLPQGYQTQLTNGQTYGEALITPSPIYSKLVEQALQTADIHYASHITGHGWRKIMRAQKSFTYIIEDYLKPHPIFQLIQKYTHSSDSDMYDTYNMGSGFALFAPSKEVEKILTIAQKLKIKAVNAGFVKKGPKKLIIKPLSITFSGQSLKIR